MWSVDIKRYKLCVQNGNQWYRTLLESSTGWLTITLPITATPLENTSTLWTDHVNWSSRTHDGIVDVGMESMDAGNQIVSLIILTHV